MQLNEEKFALWLARLRSGEVKQGSGCLRDRDNRYCCIGVMMDLMPSVEVTATQYTGDYTYRGTFGDSSATGMIVDAWAWLFDVPSSRIDRLRTGGDIVLDYPYKIGQGLDGEELTAVVMNDILRLTFSQIADMFEYFGPVPPNAGLTQALDAPGSVGN